MNNKDLSKVVVATGAAVVVVTLGAPFIVGAPLAIAVGGYLGWILTGEKRRKKDDEDKEE